MRFFNDLWLEKRMNITVRLFYGEAFEISINLFATSVGSWGAQRTRLRTHPPSTSILVCARRYKRMANYSLLKNRASL